MSATLTWYSSGVGTNSGITIQALLADIKALFDTKAGDSNFSWQVASSNVATSPYYVVLKRKDASAGRILLVAYGSAPAGNNSTLFDVAPTTVSYFYTAWFPNGNVDTPSNLAASSGTILGDDTNATKAVAQGNITTTYATTSFKPFYFDSAEAVYIGTCNPSATGNFWSGAGMILVDGSDNVYGGVLSGVSNSITNFGAGGSTHMQWQNTKPSAGSSNGGHIRTNYGSFDRTYWLAWQASGGWASQTGSGDVLTDSSISKVWFVPVPIMGLTKGEGMPLRLRQVAYGPGTNGPFAAYSTTGPVVAARAFCASTAGGNGHPWFTNSKI